METLDFFFQDLKLSWVNFVPKMNRTQFVDQEYFFNSRFLFLLLGGVLMMASPTEKKYKVYMGFKVRGFDGISSHDNGQYKILPTSSPKLYIISSTSFHFIGAGHHFHENNTAKYE
jgi:hypothetical protein